MKNLFFIAGVIAAFAATSAMAAPKFSIVGAGDFSMASYKDLADPTDPSTTLTAKTTGRAKYGAGLLVEFPLSPRVGFELGALYLTRQYALTYKLALVADPTLASEQPIGSLRHGFIQVPAMFKFHLGRVFALGLGGYFANNIGQVTRINNAGEEEKGSYADARLKRTDYGLSAGLGVAIPMGSSVAFLIDGRYNMGLANQYAPKEGDTFTEKIKNNDITAFVGFRFGANK